MRQTRVKILACILAVALLGSLNLFAYSSPGTTVTVDGVVYEILTVGQSGATVKVKSLQDQTITNLVIPATIGISTPSFSGDAEVVEIGNDSFVGKTMLKSIDLSGATHLSSIEDRAFTSCSALETATFSPALTSIGQQAFSHCTSLSLMIFNASAPQLSIDVFANVPQVGVVQYPSGATGFGSGIFAPAYLSDWYFNPVQPTITTMSLTDGKVDVAYSEQLSSSDPKAMWSLAGGSLPAGLNIDQAGLISGTPQAAGISTLIAVASNPAGADQKVLSITIEPRDPYNVQLAPSHMVFLSQAVGYTQPDPSTFTLRNVDSRDLTNIQAFLTSNVNFEITQHPIATVVAGGETTIEVAVKDGLAEGTYTDTLTVTGNNGIQLTASLEFTVVESAVAPVITTTTLPDATLDSAYTVQLEATGTSPVWSVESGALPSGLTLSPTGVIDGVPTWTGIFRFTVKAENAAGSATQQLAISVIRGSDIIQPPPYTRPYNNGGGSSRGGGSGSGGGGGGGSTQSDRTSTSTTSGSTSSWLDSSSLQSARQSAGSGAVRTRSEGVFGVRAEDLKSLGEQDFSHDTMDGNSVQMRLTISDPGQLTQDVLVSGYTTGPEVERVESFFEKWFENDVEVIQMDQAGSFDQEVEIAAKVDLTNMDIEDIQLYSYDKATNSYTAIKDPKCWVDQNGYLHFSTKQAGAIIISNGPLDPK